MNTITMLKAVIFCFIFVSFTVLYAEYIIRTEKSLYLNEREPASSVIYNMDNIYSAVKNTSAQYGEASDGERDSIMININTADEEQLKELPSIGQSRAEDIIAYRDKNGSFQSIEEIMAVDGIGLGIFNSIKGMICIK